MFVGEAHAALTTAGPSITVGVPAGTQPGDLMVASILADSTGQAGTLDPPDGWVEEASHDQGNPHFQQLRIYSRIAGSSEPANYTWTTPSNGALAAAIVTERDFDQVEAWQLTLDAALNTTFQCDGVTTTSDNAVVLYCYAINEGATPGQRIPITPHASTTKLAEAATSTIVVGQGLAVCREARPTAGATGTRNATSANLNGRNISFAISLRARIDAAIAASLGELAAAVAVDPVVDAAMGASLGELTASVAADPIADAAVAASLGALDVSVSADAVVDAAIGASLGALSVSASVDPVVEAALSASLGTLNAQTQVDSGVELALVASLGELTAQVTIDSGDADAPLVVESESLAPSLPAFQQLLPSLTADGDLIPSLHAFPALAPSLEADQRLEPSLAGINTLEPRS